MGKWSDRSVDDIETELKMQTQSNLGSKDATTEKASNIKQAEDTYKKGNE